MLKCASVTGVCRSVWSWAVIKDQARALYVATQQVQGFPDSCFYGDSVTKFFAGTSQLHTIYSKFKIK
jgi:hypothetical protein